MHTLRTRLVSAPFLRLPHLRQRTTMALIQTGDPDMPPLVSSSESDHRVPFESERSDTSDDLSTAALLGNGDVTEFSCLVKAIRDSTAPHVQPVPTAPRRSKARNDGGLPGRTSNMLNPPLISQTPMERLEARCGPIFPAGPSSSLMLAHLMATRIRNGV